MFNFRGRTVEVMTPASPEKRIAKFVTNLKSRKTKCYQKSRTERLQFNRLVLPNQTRGLTRHRSKPALNELWFKNLHLPETALVGEEGEGFYQMLDGLNEERLVIAAECVGLGEAAIEAGVEYANEREVFDRLIGSNQAIQHPLAEAFSRVQAAKQIVHASAKSVETDVDLGARANMSKFLAADAAFQAADVAVQTHGRFGVAREYDAERYFREARLTHLVPITQQLALNYIGEKVLGLP